MKIKHTNQLEIAQNEIWTPQKSLAIRYPRSVCSTHNTMWECVPASTSRLSSYVVHVCNFHLLAMVAHVLLRLAPQCCALMLCIQLVIVINSEAIWAEESW